MKRIVAMLLVLALLPGVALAAELTDGYPEDMPNFFYDPEWGDPYEWEHFLDQPPIEGDGITVGETVYEEGYESDDYQPSEDGQYDEYGQFWPYDTFEPRVELIVDEWAKNEVTEADWMGVLSDRLRTADLRKNVSRVEFAEMCVLLLRVYVTRPTNFGNPFSDTEDEAAIMAYYYGITSGTGKNADGSRTFSPHAAITRQDAATMLLRTYKRIMMPGWNIDSDGMYDLNYAMPAPFDDDSSLASYARASVYFLSAKGIIKGYNENGRLDFRPGGLTSRQEALILVRRLDNILSY